MHLNVRKLLEKHNNEQHHWIKIIIRLTESKVNLQQKKMHE